MVVDTTEPRRPTRPEHLDAPLLDEESAPTMTFSEAGRRGGETVKERYGTPFFQTIGRLGAERGAEKGGEARKKVLGSDGYAKLGRMGGKAVVQKLGREHMRAIGRKGGKARVAQSQEATRDAPPAPARAPVTTENAQHVLPERGRRVPLDAGEPPKRKPRADAP